MFCTTLCALQFILNAFKCNTLKLYWMCCCHISINYTKYKKKKNTTKTKWFSQQNLSLVSLRRSGQFPQHSFLFVTMATAPLYKVLPSPSLITLLSPELKQQQKKATIITASQERRANPQLTNSSLACISRKYIWTLFFLTADTLTLLRKQHNGRLERESPVSLLPYRTGEL